jgi:hypothetical protein
VIDSEDDDGVIFDLPNEWVTAILIQGAPNWEYIQPGSYRQDRVKYSDTVSMACFFADSAVTPEKIFGFVENLQAIRYADPENPVDVPTRTTYIDPGSEDRLLP